MSLNGKKNKGPPLTFKVVKLPNLLFARLVRKYINPHWALGHKYSGRESVIYYTGNSKCLIPHREINPCGKAPRFPPLPPTQTSGAPSENGIQTPAAFKLHQKAPLAHELYLSPCF